MMKFIKWLWTLCNVNPQRFALASAKREGPKNANGKEAIKKTCNHLGALRRSIIYLDGLSVPFRKFLVWSPVG